MGIPAADGGEEYTAKITPNGQGDITIAIAANVAADAAGNGNQTAMPATVAWDVTAPTVEIKGAPQLVADDAPFVVTVTFGEPVEGFAAADIRVTNGMATDVGMGVPTADGGEEYAATITPDGQGDITIITIAIDAAVVTDAAGNDNEAATSVTVVRDTTVPTVKIEDEPAVVMSVAPFDVTVAFSVPVFGFAAADIQVTNGDVTELKQGEATADGGEEYTATITPNGRGDITIRIGEDAATDASGKGLLKAVAARIVFNRAPDFSSDDAFQVAENTTAVGTVVAADADTGDDITGYVISGGADREAFSIVASTGVLAFKRAPNHEQPTDQVSTTPANAAGNNEYLVVVTATGGAGDRAMTTDQTITVTVTDVAEAPTAPGKPVILAVTATGFTAGWAAPANAGPEITDYEVEYRVVGDPVWTNAGHSGTALTVTLTALAPGTDYEVQVRAINPEGRSAWSAVAIATTRAAPGVTVSRSALTVIEAGTGTYTVVLDGAPTAAVTIAVMREAGGDEDLTARPATLMFTTANWSTAQTVTVSAAADTDAAAGTATIAHTAGSADTAFDGIDIASVTVTESDTGLCGTGSTALSGHSGTGILRDCNTLLGLKDELRGTQSLNWSADTAILDWDGVVISGNSLLELNMLDEDFETIPLHGSLPSALGQLTSLERISMPGGTLSGTIPPELGQLASLTSIDLDNNNLSGSIPSELGQLKRLTVLALSNNSLSGSIPAELGRLANLNTLYLQANELSGSIPAELGQLTRLTDIGLNNNDLSGCIPPAISKFKSDIHTQGGSGSERTLELCLAGPTALSASAGDGQATLSWTAPSGTLTGYQYRQSSDGGATYSEWKDASGTKTTHTVLGLTNGATYSFQVRAVNLDGNGAASQAATVTLDVQVRVSESALTVTEGGAATYTVVLDAAPTGGVLITVARADGGDSDLTAAPTMLTFTTATWSTAQTVTLRAADDADAHDGSATFTHSAIGGGYGSAVIASVTATEADDDTAGVTVSGDGTLSVPEGGSATYTVVLDTQPSGAVTVSVAKQSGGDDDLSVDPAELTFTTDDWNTAQTVTVTAADDEDAAAGTASVGHAATSTDSDYGAITIASVTATEDDDDTAGVSVDPQSLSVTEGAMATYTVVLDTLPSDSVTVSVAKQSGGDPDLAASATDLTFTTADWNTAQTVTVTAAVDGDQADGQAMFAHSASSTDGDYGGITIAPVTATEDDKDKPGVTVTPPSLPVAEGSTASYTVALTTQPTASVTVSLSASGDSDLTVSTTALTFTAADWNTAQTVTVSAAEDDDAADGTATIAHTASSADSGYDGIAITIASVTATEDDDDTVGVTVDPETLSVTEESTATYTVVLDTLPTGPVTVSVAKQSGGDDDLTVSTTALTFTTADWNTAQTVTVSAAEDDDAADGTATIAHTASSTDSGYNGIAVTIASVTATENDNDTVGVTVDPEALSVTEESTATYTVVLDTLPTGAVTVSVAKQSGGDPSLTVSPAALTFTTDDWSTAQTVTVSAADDVDSTNGAATFTHSASGADYGSVVIDSVTATESDNDTFGVTVSPTALPVTEGSTASYTVALTTQPTADVTVSLSASGDSDLTVSTTALTFTTADWNTAQTVTVTAADDDDAADGTATIAHTASSADSGYDGIAITIASVTATESDTDTVGVTVDPKMLSVTEESTAAYTVVLDTLPTGPVTVSVAKQGRGRRRPERSPGGAHLHDGELEHGADGDGIGGGRRGHGRRHGDDRAHRGQHRQRIQRNHHRLGDGDGRRQRRAERGADIQQRGDLQRGGERDRGRHGGGGGRRCAGQHHRLCDHRRRGPGGVQHLRYGRPDVRERAELRSPDGCGEHRSGQRREQQRVRRGGEGDQR